MKKIISLVAFLAMTLVTPVNADISPRTSGNGYDYGTFVHNGVAYNYSHSLYNIGSGLGASLFTTASVIHQHSSLRATFTTATHGIDTNYSDPVICYAVCNGANPVYSKYNDPTGIINGSASVIILSNPVFKSDIEISFWCVIGLKLTECCLKIHYFWY